MKKITSILAVVAAMVSLASCNKEVAAPADAENGITATFTVNLPEQTATKAISDGTLADELLFFAYDAAGNHLDLDQTVTVSGKHASVSVNLVGGITYQFVFWAQKAGQYTNKFSSDKKTLTLDPTEMMNSDAWDAFYYKMTKDVKSSFSETVTLTRPFAQLNLGAPVKLNDSNVRIGGDFWAASKSGIKIDATLKTSYKIKANNVLSLLEGTASGDTEYTLTAASHPEESLTVGGVKYDYAAMAYLLANTTKSELTDLEITLNTEQGDTPVSLTRTVHNVPLQRNYRTNVLGNVFTLEANFDIVVDSDFSKDDNGNVVDHLPEYANIAALNAAFAKNPAEDAEKWSYKVKVLTAGDTKTIVLPKTLDPVDIYFAEGAFVNEDITIAYADGATDGEKPVKLTIEAPLTGSNTKSINKLVGNLPATTVVLAGTTTVDTADFYTASSTLHLMPKAKIINKLTVFAGSLLVEGFIETAVIDPSVAVNTVDAVAKVAEDGEVVRFIVQNLNAVIEKGAKVGTLEVSTTNDYDGAAPTVTVKGEVDEVIASTETGATVVPSVDIQDTAEVTTVEQKGNATVSISDNADVETVEAEDPGKITGEGAEDVEFLIKSEADLNAVVAAGKTTGKVGADFEVVNPVGINSNFTLNLNGYTITNNVYGNRLFRLGDATLTLDGGEKGGKFIIPESNKNSYGFVDMRNIDGDAYQNAVLIANNVSFEGATTGGSFFRGRTHYQKFIFTDVCVDNDAGDGTIVDGYTNGENCSIINCYGYQICTVTIKGGTYKYASRGLNYGVFQDYYNAFSSFEDVTVISTDGPVNQGMSYSCTIKNCNFSNPSNVDANSWTNTAICASNNKTINVDGGYYEGNYALYVYSSGGVINVTGGTFIGNTDVIVLETDKNSYPSATSTVNISGGTFKGDFRVQAGDVLSISGGTFDHDPSAYVADGYKAKKISETEWIVEESDEVNYSFTAFNAAVIDNDGVFDGSDKHPGKTVVVTISASERSVRNNNTAQFYLGQGKGDKINGIPSITVKNVTFKYNHDADDGATALNTGEVYFVAMDILVENCTFTEQSGLSSWGFLGNDKYPPVSMTVKDCTFENLTGRYGVHQNRAKSLTVTGCTFNCERGIHTNSPTPESIVVKNNTFTGIDNTKGALCLAEDMVNIAGATLDIQGNDATGQAMLRSLNASASVEQIAAIRDNNTFGTLYTTNSSYMPVE